MMYRSVIPTIHLLLWTIPLAKVVATVDDEANLASFLPPPGDAAANRYRGVGTCSDAPCDDDLEFCGTDHTCHVYSCDHWYRWGPPEYTGHILQIMPVEIFRNTTVVLAKEPAEIPSLECVDVTLNVRAPSVIFGCTGWSCVGNNCQGYYAHNSPSQGVAQEFLQRCTARLGALEFVCHDDTRTDTVTAMTRSNDDKWNNFRTAVEFSDIQPCTTPTDGNRTDPLFIYTQYVSSPFFAVMGSSSTTDFNETHAAATLHSVLDFVDEDDSSGCPQSAGATWMAVVGMILWSMHSLLYQ